MNITLKVSGRCARCETLPSRVKGTGRLYLWFLLEHSVNKTIHYLHSSGLEHQLLEDEQYLLINLNEAEIAGMAIELAAILTSKELKDTRTLFMTGAAEPQLRDWSRITDLGQFVSLTQSGWLLDILAQDAGFLIALDDLGAGYCSLNLIHQLRPDFIK